jgi:hypothetical protein
MMTGYATIMASEPDRGDRRSIKTRGDNVPVIRSYSSLAGMQNLLDRDPPVIPSSALF